MLVRDLLQKVGLKAASPMAELKPPDLPPEIHALADCVSRYSQSTRPLSLLRLLDNRQLLCIGEDHQYRDTPYMMLTRALPHLRSKGFNKIALEFDEGEPADSLIHFNNTGEFAGYLTMTTPVEQRLLITARGLGFSFHGVDINLAPPGHVQFFPNDMPIRDQYMHKSIKHLMESDNGGLIFLVGFMHLPLNKPNAPADWLSAGNLLQREFESLRIAPHILSKSPEHPLSIAASLLPERRQLFIPTIAEKIRRLHVPHSDLEPEDRHTYGEYDAILLFWD